MFRILLRIALSLLLIACPFVSAQETQESPEVEKLPDMTVTGVGEEDELVIDPALDAGNTPDVASLARKTPGGNLNNNGPIAGQVQYRGLFGPRMNVRIDGMYIDPGGPNWMDAPMHYMPLPLLKSYTTTRGIAPVSTGPGLAGWVDAEFKSSEFTSEESFDFNGDIASFVRSVSSGYGLGGILSMANRRHRLHVLGSTESADDIEFGDGKIGASEYERHVVGAGYGFNTGEHKFGFDYRRFDTGPSGTPSLPLDEQFFDTNFFKGDYDGQWRELDVRAKLYYSDIDHRMDNFTLRVVPTPRRRFVNVTSDGLGYDLDGTLPLWGGELRFGVDGSLNSHNSTIFNPGNAQFSVVNFNDADTDAYGFFGEWGGQFLEQWGFELGVRYTRVDMSAGPVDATGVPPPVLILRDRFNNADRNKDDNNVDVVAKLNYQIHPDLSAELGFGRKTRSPYYVERYGWIPLEVNEGLGDFNNYIGNVDLDPEVSHQVEFSLDWRPERFYFSPRGFYRKVDDYIQGVPVTDPVVIGVSTANGDPTPLQYANVDAELFGADALMGVKLSDNWALDGIISYVRGKRTDIDDNLYRIPPLNGIAALTYRRTTWSASIEGVFYDRQDKISRTIVLNEPRSNNAPTAGYSLLNLWGRWAPVKQAHVTLGIDNVFDKTYEDNLTGFNHVTNSDVLVGNHLPGAGRNFFAKVEADW